MYIARVLLCILVCTVSIMFSFCVVVREKFPSMYSLTSLSFKFQPCCLWFWKKCSLQEIILYHSQTFPLSNFWLFAVLSDNGKAWELRGYIACSCKRCCSPMVLCSLVPRLFFSGGCENAVWQGTRLGLSLVIMSHPCTYMLKVLPKDCMYLKTKICLK